MRSLMLPMYAPRIRLSTSLMSPLIRFFEFVCFYLMIFAFHPLLRHALFWSLNKLLYRLVLEPLAEGDPAV
jgi:hypothetical protein